MWSKILQLCSDSETIFLARLQMIAGILWNVLPTIDPELFHDLIGNRWFGAFLIVWGVLTEIARRRRDPEMK